MAVLEGGQCVASPTVRSAAALAGTALDRHTDRRLLAAAARGVVKIRDNGRPHSAFDQVSVLYGCDFVQAAHDGLVAAAVVVAHTAVIAVVVGLAAGIDFVDWGAAAIVGPTPIAIDWDASGVHPVRSQAPAYELHMRSLLLLL